MEIKWPWNKPVESEVSFFVPITGFGVVETQGLDGKPIVTLEQFTRLKNTKEGLKGINPIRQPDGRYLLS